MIKFGNLRRHKYATQNSGNGQLRRICVSGVLLAGLGAGLPARAAASPSKSQTYVVRLKNDVNLSTFLVAQIKRGVTPTDLFTSVFPGFQSRLTPSAYQRLKRDSKVLSISRSQTFSIPRTPIVRGVGYVWGLDRLDQRRLPMNNLYAPNTSGRGVTAFVIDTGVDGSHPEFGTRVARGFSAVKGQAANTDCRGHGTHVAGTIAGNNVGVANGAAIVPVKVFGCTGGATTGQILDGIDYVIALHRANEPAVANLSLGGPIDPALDAGIRAMVSDGITVVVAAGNEGQDACRVSPAREPLAITVGAVSQTDTKASFSNFGRCLDVFAPGVEILSAYPNGRYAQADGTSMAAPHVAGVAALVLESNPSLTPSQVSSAILSGATQGLVVTPGAGSPNLLAFSNVDVQTPPSPTVPPVTTVPGRTSPTTTTAPTTTTIPVAAPGTITGLQAIASPRSIVAIWTGPRTGGVATGYDVEFKRSSDSTWTPVASTTTTSVTINSLAAGTYLVRVAAKNSVGRSAFAESSPVTIAEEAVRVTLSSATFKNPWSRATVSELQLDSGGGQVSLEVNLSAQSKLPSGADQVWGQLCPASAMYPDPNRCTGSLFPGESNNGTSGTYGGLFIVSSAVPTGTWFATIEVRTTDRVVHVVTIPVTIQLLPVPVSVPGAPTGLNIAASESSAQLSWTAPSTNGGASITDYVVEYWAKGGSSWTRVQDGVSSTTSATVPSLTANTYSFRVAAVNSAGVGTFVQSGDVQVGPTIQIFSDKYMNTSGVTITSIRRVSGNFAWVYYEVRLTDPFGGRLPDSFGGQLCPVNVTYPDFNRCTGATFGRQAGHSLDSTYRGLFGIGSAASTGLWKVTFDVISGVRIESSRRITVS